MDNKEQLDKLHKMSYYEFLRKSQLLLPFIVAELMGEISTGKAREILGISNGDYDLLKRDIINAVNQIITILPTGHNLLMAEFSKLDEKLKMELGQ